MKDILKNLNSFIYICITATLLTACGGSSSDKNKYTISANINSIKYSNEVLVESNASTTVNVNFQGDGLLLGFAPDASPAAWLNYRTENVTSTSATIHVDVVNEELIAPGLYTTKLRLSTGDIDKTNLVHHDIDVELRVWQLTPDTQSMVFNTTFGEQTVTSQSFELISVDNEWSVSSNVDWLSFEPSSGTGTSTITVTPTITDFTAPGLQQANIIFTETTTGDTKSLPLELGLDNVYLYADKPNIAFTETANIKSTEKTLTILTNGPELIDWQATTEAQWLTLSKVAETNQLIITASAETLADKAVSSAEITISSVESNHIISSVIPVNFYKNTDLTENQSVSDIIVNSQGMESAPSLPYVYVATLNELRTYHQYTGELLNTLVVSPENTLLEQLLVDPTGSFILAKADETISGEDDDGNPTEEIVTHRYKINITDNSITEITDASIEYEPQSFVRFNNRSYVVTQTLEFADENLQRLYWDAANAYFARATDTASEKEIFYALDGNTSTFKRYQITSNDFTSEKVSASLTHEYKPELLEESDVVVNFVSTNDDTGLYAISPTSEWISFDGTTFTDNGLLETNEAVVTLALAKNSLGRAHYAKFDQTQGFYLDIFNEQQAIAATQPIGSSQPSSIEVSADDSRLLIDAQNSSSLELVSITQFNSSAETLDFTTTLGNSSVDSQQLTLTGIGANWTATTNVDWLILTPTASDESNTLDIAIDTSKITTGGRYTATISIYDPSSQSYKLITVDFAVDDIRLYSSYNALAFNDTPSQKVLVHTVDVLTNSETSINWQANTDVSWLTLSADNTNNTLTITAMPASAADDELSNATITISSTEADKALSGTINVSLNKQTTDATDVTLNDITANSQAITLDLIRPYIYIGSGEHIHIYHIGTGALINSISSPLAGFDLTNFVMHPDGQSMLVSNEETYTDENDEQQTRVNHYRVNLANQTISQVNAEDITIEFRPVLIKNIDGMPVVITQTQEFADINLVRQSWDQANAVFAQNTASAASKDSFYFANSANSELIELALEYNAYADNLITSAQSSSFVNENFATLVNFALSSSGDKIYTANSVLEWSSYDGSNYSAQGVLHSGSNITTLNTTVDSANNSYFYRFDPLVGFTLTKYDQSQAEIWSQTLTSGSSQNYISPDYMRVISLNSTTNTLTISSMP